MEESRLKTGGLQYFFENGIVSFITVFPVWHKSAQVLGANITNLDRMSTEVYGTLPVKDHPGFQFRDHT